MRVLLISTYELGHQPLHVASPAGTLRRAGHDVRCLDLSLERLDPGALDWAQAVAFSVPMHTAARLAVQAARAVRSRNAALPICLYGLYAPTAQDTLLADHAIGGEYERPLLAWVDQLARGERATPKHLEPALIDLGRSEFGLPARDLVPPLERYAHLALGGDERVVGYVEASHGCVHKCRHCPIPPTYDGRIRIVGREAVLDDVEQLVAMGARHITFGDPDFLNGRRHSLAVAEAVHARHPELTFDCTTKVEHILECAQLWPRLAEFGCLFVVTALECVQDEILERLDKGHTTADASAAIALLREHGIEPRPSFMPFTPWTTRADLAALLDFVAAHDLVDNVDPIQYSIRLLVPAGSLLADHPDMRPYLGRYDAERLSFEWTAEEPEVDELQRRIALLVESSLAAGEHAAQIFAKLRTLVDPAAPVAIPSGSVEGRPRLTEPWFC